MARLFYSDPKASKRFLPILIAFLIPVVTLICIYAGIFILTYRDFYLNIPGFFHDRTG